MTSIDDFDLPTPLEAAKMFATWRTIAPPDHKVALLIRDLQRTRAVGFNFQVPPVLGAGGWFAALMPASDDQGTMEHLLRDAGYREPACGPRRLACFAYRDPRGRLPDIVAWLSPIDPQLTWTRLHFPHDARACLTLHRLVEAQFGAGLGCVAPIDQT